MDKAQDFLQWVFDKFQGKLNFLWFYEGRFSDEDFEKRMREEADYREISDEHMVVSYVENIESKASALLSHVSIMLALTGMYFVIAESSVALNLLLSFEIIGYIWVALCSLRCLMQLSTHDFLEHPEGTFIEGIRLEGFKRELIFRHALQVLVLFSLIFVVIIILHSAVNVI